MVVDELKTADSQRKESRMINECHRMSNKSIPQLMKVKIKAPKMDPFRQGVDIFLGKMSKALRPVSAVLAFLAKRGCAEGILSRFHGGQENDLLQE